MAEELKATKRCAACRKEKPVSEMKVCMHAQMHNYVCDSKCMNDFYNPPKKTDDHSADDLTMVRVPREVLERALQDCSFLPLETTAQCNIDRNAAVRDLRTLLAQHGKAVGDE